MWCCLLDQSSFCSLVLNMDGLDGGWTEGLSITLQ